MVSAGDFRNGLTIEYEGNVYQIIEFQHVKPGKGAAFVRTKLKKYKEWRRCRKNFPSDRKNVRRPILKEKICSIFIVMAIYITLWMWKPTTRLH